MRASMHLNVHIKSMSVGL